ncbi:MAG: hypothetical protein WBD16_14250 [Pyrinomonadaceae bacterium]
MFIFFTFADLAAVEMMLVSIPESLGLLAFGVALVAVAVMGRWLLARGEEVKEKEEIRKKAEVG